jgi:hypothetical protein
LMKVELLFLRPACLCRKEVAPDLLKRKANNNLHQQSTWLTVVQK